MTTEAAIEAREHLRLPLEGWIDHTGLVAASWSMAGGVVGGGIWVWGMGRHVSFESILPVTTVMFALGAGLGLVHGAVLGLLAHYPDTSPRALLRSLAVALIGMLPGLAVAWIAAMWIAMSRPVVRMGELIPWAGVLLGWTAGAVICLWALFEGIRCARATCAQYPHWRLGISFLSSTFLLLLVLFEARHPELWWTDLKVNSAGAALLALGIVVWGGLPVVLAASWIARHRRAGSLDPSRRS